MVALVLLHTFCACINIRWIIELVIDVLKKAHFDNELRNSSCQLEHTVRAVYTSFPVHTEVEKVRQRTRVAEHID